MPITTQRTGLTTTPMFVREGTAFTVPSSSTASSQSKPGAADLSWVTGLFGSDVEDFKVAPESESYEHMGGQPGGLVVLDVIELSKKLKITWTSQQVDATAYALAFGTLALTSSSNQANPLEGALVPRGWLKFQSYDGAGTLRMVGDLWVALKVADVEPLSGKNAFKAKFEATVIRSPLNTLAFS